MTVENYERIETEKGRLEVEITKGENYITIDVENTQIGDLKTIEIIDETEKEVIVID